MSLRASTSPRLSGLGLVSMGVVAFALVALQGCAGATVTSSSLKEPGIAVVGLGPLRADPPAKSSPPRERSESSRPSSDRERNVRVHSVCRRCSQ